MSEFDAVGRDVAAAADSSADNPVALAVKQLWPWAGFDQGDNPNHLWKVEFWKNENGFAVAATLVDKNVWASEPTPAPPATPEELRLQAAQSEVAPETVDNAELESGLTPDPAPEPTAAISAEG